MLSKAARILAGIVLGALCYVPPVLLLGLFLPQGPGGATGFAIVANILFTAVIVIGLILQAVTTFLLRRSGIKYVIAGVWLFYPVVAVGLIGLKAYVDLRVTIAAREDYSGREIALPAGEYRDLLLVITPRERDGSYFYGKDRCMDPCMSALRAGVVDSLAKPALGEIVRQRVFSGGFNVFRHARGEACRVADGNRDRFDAFWRANSRTLQGLTRLRYWAEDHTGEPEEDVTRQRLLQARRDEQPILDEYLEILASPRTDSLAVMELTSSGYLDECITMTFHRSFDHDIQISYGSDLRRPYVPSYQVAEIHAFRDGEPYRVARFEYGGREEFPGPPFTIAEIITKITGRPFDPDLPRHPIENIEAELERLATLLEGGAYISNSRALAEWVNEVFRTEAREFSRTADGGGHWDVSLSAEEISDLIRLAPTDSAEWRQRFFDKTSTYLDRQTIESIMQAEAQRE